VNLLGNRQLFRLPRCFIAAISLPVQLFAAVMPTAPDGFLIEKVASEPGVRFPMFATFDDRGRLFVAESSGLDLYAELSAQTRKCRVRLLEDRDGDGRFESSRVFADRLVFPMGIAWREDKLYVADPPDLVCFSDSNGDGQADERQVVLTGFGHKDNGSLHGLVFGPDGWLYMTMGEPDGYRLARGDGSFLEGESGALIRCRPDGSQPEVVCRGFVNLIEVVFTPAGDILGTDNWFQWPSGGVRDALIHLQEGGLYPLKLEDKGTPMPKTGVTLPPLALFPAVALSGLARYEAASFPPEMHGNLFSTRARFNGTDSNATAHRFALQRTNSWPVTIPIFTRPMCSRMAMAVCSLSIPAAGMCSIVRPEKSARRTRPAAFTACASPARPALPTRGAPRSAGTNCAPPNCSNDCRIPVQPFAPKRKKPL
jgi:putative membrane-bound dehydrogenase-like protein